MRLFRKIRLFPAFYWGRMAVLLLFAVGVAVSTPFPWIRWAAVAWAIYCMYDLVINVLRHRTPLPGDVVSVRDHDGYGIGRVLDVNADQVDLLLACTRHERRPRVVPYSAIRDEALSEREVGTVERVRMTLKAYKQRSRFIWHCEL